MARPFELVKDINDIKELWKVAVRVYHKWTVVSKNKEHFEMLLCDKEGSDIHCRVPTMYKQTFDSVLTVNGNSTFTFRHLAFNGEVNMTAFEVQSTKITGILLDDLHVSEDLTAVSEVLEVYVEKVMQNIQKITFPGEANEAPNTITGDILETT
ncbi:uncharacterized protein LOC131614895 [Vicia villosa]|uniref:uncharacterized protein LOC131614895 n=1 Tax=Vicia villosa TaxID=3911 RepID=UPI00273B6031|nr:uncharacterized protein LOC131614895 [Vicia villosa]